MEFAGLTRQRERLAPALDAAVKQVLDGGRYIGGPQVARLERALAGLTGVAHCLGCASGTDALTLPLLAWGTGAGEAVFLPAFTFAATAEAVALRGATPVFVDVGDDYNLDPDALEAAIERVKQAGRLRPAGVIAVDLFGLAADYERIEPIAAAAGLWLLEDAAQSLGGRRFGRAAGAFGQAAATSFFPAKPLGCYGDGGALLTGDTLLAGKIESLRAHGRGRDKYDHRLVGMNSRLDTMQAAILLEKLVVFSDELARREALAQRYSARLAGAVETPTLPEGAASSWAQYVIALPDRQTRDALRLFLSARGVPTAVHYPRPLHLQKAFGYLGVKKGALPCAEAASRRVLSLPLHPYLTDEEQGRVCDGVLDFVAGRPI